jgi:hypothetical protein
LKKRDTVKHKRTTSGDWPIFDSPLLAEVAQAFALRRKAIRYRSGICCEREFSETAEGAVERLNLRSRHLILSVWAEGVMFFGVAVPAAGAHGGWTFEDHFHGDVNDVAPQTLVRMFEATIGVPFGNDAFEEREGLRRIWARVSPYAG